MALIDYISSTPLDLEKAIGEFPAAYVPLGSLEWHSEHLPLGLDGLKAELLLRRVAENIGNGVFFPTMYWHAFDTMNFKYTFHFAKYPAKRIAKQLYNMGFKIIVLLTGHYPASQVKNVRSAARSIMKAHKDAFVLGIAEQMVLHDLGYTGDHAAAGETSLALALFPEQVLLDKLPEGYDYISRCKYLGIMGKDPVIHANKEYGQELVENFVKRMSRIIQDAWESQDQASIKAMYADYDAKMTDIKSIKRLPQAASALGMDSPKDLLRHLKWMIFKRSRQQFK